MSKALQNKLARAARRAKRVRSVIQGTSERPRMSVHRSLSHISVQLIDDVAGTTLAFASDKEIKKGTKTDKSIEVGKLIAAKAKDKKISKVIFDRGSFRYHGRVKALADAAREAGMQF